MKRILFAASAIVLSCSTLFAQSNIKVILGSSPVNDSTIVMNSTVADSLIVVALNVVNTDASAIDVRVRRIDSVVIAGSQNYLCWGLCYGAQSAYVWLAPSNETINAHDTNKTFTGDYQPHGHVGTEIIRYDFFNPGNSSDSTWVIVEFNIAPLGIAKLNSNHLSFSAPYPNPATDNVSFNYHLSNDAQQAKLEIYNTLGQCVQTHTLNWSNTKLSLNTKSLPAGIYICKLEASGKTPAYQRLIVTH